MAKSKHRTRDIATASNSPQAAGVRNSVWIICVLLGLSVLAVYGRVRHYPFINYDDDTYVTNNPHVQAGLSWATIQWSMTTMDATNWHPLTWLSHALDCQLFGLDAGWHHLTNVLIHAVSAVLLFLLLQEVTGARWRSLLVAGLFGLHPFNVGTVAWIAERKNVLSTLILFLTLGAYGWYARKPTVQRYGLMAALFALGLLAKPMMVTLPFALLLLDFWPLRRVVRWSRSSQQFPVPQVSTLRLIVEKLPLLALSLASCVLTLKAQREEVQVAAIPFGARMANAICSYGLYVWKTIFPSGFSIFYPHAFTNPSIPPGVEVWWTLSVSVVFMIALTLFAWWQRKARPYLITGWMWYLGTLIPVIGIVQVGPQAMADRYAYVPLLGIFVIIAWGGNELAERFGLSMAWRQGLAAAVLGILAILSFRELGHWKTSLDLWLHARAVTTNDYYADVQIGNLLAAEQKPEALQYYREAVQFAPWNTETQFPLAVSLQYQGFLQEAADHYSAFLRLTGDRHEAAFAYANLSIIYGQLGDFDRVHVAFQRASRSDPQVVADMISNVTQAAKDAPSDDVYFCLGLLLEQSGKLSQARDAYLRALKLNPDQQQAKRALARLDEGTGRSSGTDKPM